MYTADLVLIQFPSLNKFHFITNLMVLSYEPHVNFFHYTKTFNRKGTNRDIHIIQDSPFKGKRRT